MNKTKGVILTNNKNGDIEIFMKSKSIKIPANKVYSLFKTLKFVVEFFDSEGLLFDSFGEKVKLQK